MSIWTKQFWKDAAERVVSSAAQGFLTGAGLGKYLETGDVTGMVTVFGDWHDFPLDAALLGAGGLAVYTLCKALIAAPVSPQGSAGFVEVPAAKAKPRKRPAAKRRPDTRTAYTRVELPSEDDGPDHEAGPGRPPFKG